MGTKQTPIDNFNVTAMDCASRCPVRVDLEDRLTSRNDRIDHLKTINADLLAALKTVTERLSLSFYDSSDDNDADPIMQAVGNEIVQASVALQKATGASK